MTLQDKVEIYLKTNELYTLEDVKRQFPDENGNSLKSAFYRIKRLNNDATIATVRIEDIEPLIAKELTKGYDQQVIRLALDLVKLKQIDKGIDDDLDVSAYIRKAQEVLNNIED